MSEILRETAETKVSVRLTLGASGAAPGPAGLESGDPVLNHVLTTLARYSGLNLAVTAQGDLRHHLIEDVAISIGLALREVIPPTCRRYGHATVPMDDALVEAALDAGGRAHFEGRLPSRLYEHFFRSLAINAGVTLHLRVLRGRDRHHVVEAAVKATGFALHQALAEGDTIFSTKGGVRVTLKAEG